MDRDQLYNDPVEAFRIGFAGQQANIYTSGPGIVTAVDWDEMTCSVQPAIQGTITDESGIVRVVNLPLLIHVPIVFQKGGNFVITMPIAVGDEVLISWANRCIDAWWQQGGVQPPIEARMHDISDGFAIAGPFSQPNVVPNVSSTAAQIRTKDGATRVSLEADGTIKLISPTGIELEGPTKVTGALEVTGNVDLMGDLTQVGNQDVTGEIEASGQITSGLIPLTTHKHTGVTPGGGTSGPATP